MERGEGIPQIKPVPLGKVHYLPHHEVLRHDKDTTKLRVVYDTLASTNGVSLNSFFLHTSPSLLQDLMDILVRFRLQEIALVADIEKAFLTLLSLEGGRGAHCAGADF